MALLEAQSLKKVYTTRFGGNQIQALSKVSFTVEQGEYVAIMGESGSGKTTLLNILAALDRPTGGQVILGGKSLSGVREKELAAFRRNNLGFVFQDFMLLDGLSVFENICLPQIIAHGPVVQMEEKAKNICRLFGIEKIMEKYPAEISGGEKQRTAVARALMNQPYVILADEPTGNLDSKSCKAVIDAFLQAKREMGATIFMVTHDSFAASFCDRVIVLKDGQVYGELKRKGTRREFMDGLLDTIRTLGGDGDDNE